MAQYILKIYYFLSCTFFGTNFHEIGPLYANRPFVLQCFDMPCSL